MSFSISSSRGHSLLNRRDFVLASLACAGAASGAYEETRAGVVRHILPTVSHDRILLKVSFDRAVAKPVLRAGSRLIAGTRTDTEGHFWTFDVPQLKPSAAYELELLEGRKGIDRPWSIRTFPHPSESVSGFRLLVYTCAGGHPVLRLPDGQLKFLSLETRRKMLARALSFQPDAVIANGDHVYWDLLTSGGKTQGASAEAVEFAGKFDRAAPIFGTPNERVLQRAAGPQIADLYGTSFRSVPVFFITDDHDHFDNDEADDNYVSFPPDAFMLRAARATRTLYYPEFLPDQNRPAGLAGASAADTPAGTSEAFGTLRFGNLAEILLYDCRRFLTLSGPTAGFIPRETENWISSRLADPGVNYVVQAPSVPVGWSAGKWGDWYPDILDSRGVLGTTRSKPFWQSGWGAQHDRILAATSARRIGAPLFLCGDLHAIGFTEVLRTGSMDLKANPVLTALTGPVSTGPTGWPSSARGTPPAKPVGIDADEKLPAFENHGFTLVDFSPDAITLQFFRWSPELGDAALEAMQPFHRQEIRRRG